MKNFRELLPLLLILTLAAVVRLVGIDWALPAVYHVDEGSLVRAAMGMRFGDLNPKFFDWPSLYKYLCFFLFSAFIKFRVPFQLLFGVETMRRVLPFWWGSVAPFHLLARLLTMCFDLGSIALIYLIGKKLSDRRVGLLSALVMALSFTNVHGTQYSRLDVPTLFFVLVSFWFSLRVLQGQALRDCLLAGLFAGFAASTKYNGALVVVAIIAAHLLCKAGPCRKRKLLLSGLASITGFLLGTPYALLDYKTFLQPNTVQGGFLWQVKSTGHGLNWWNFIIRSVLPDWGILMALLFLAGAVWAIWKHRKKDILLLSFPLVYFAYAGSWGIVRSHYILLMYPFLVILAARFLLSFWEPKFGRAVPMAILIACLIHPFSRIVRDDISGLRNDTRNLAYNWILENIPYGTQMAIDGPEPTSHLGGSLPNLPRAEDGRGYFLHPWEKTVKEYGRDWGKMLLEFERRDVEFFIASSFVHSRYEDRTFYRLLDENAELVKHFSPDWLTGPEIGIYRIRLSSF